MTPLPALVRPPRRRVEGEGEGGGDREEITSRFLYIAGVGEAVGSSLEVCWMMHDG